MRLKMRRGLLDLRLAPALVLPALALALLSTTVSAKHCASIEAVDADPGSTFPDTCRRRRNTSTDTRQRATAVVAEVEVCCFLLHPQVGQTTAAPS